MAAPCCPRCLRALRTTRIRCSAGARCILLRSLGGSRSSNCCLPRRCPCTPPQPSVDLSLRPRTLPNAVRVCGRRRSPHSHQRQWTRRRRQVRRRCTWRRPMGTPLWCSACCNTAPPSITATTNWVTPHCILRLLKHAPAWSRCWYNMAPMVSNSLAGALGDHTAAHASLLLCPAPVERPQDVTHGLRMRYVLVRSACRR